MGSNDFLWYLAVLSARSLGLACVAWLALRVFGVKSASARHAVWTVVAAVMLIQVLVSRGLPRLPIRVLAPVVTDTAPAPRNIVEKFPVDVLYVHSETRRVVSWRQAVTGLYAAVAAILFARLIMGYVFTRRLVRSSMPAKDARIRESERISVPMTVGQVTPTILLPSGWREWDSATLQAVLAHEEAHVRRGDWAIGVMARINCCVFWFHPLAWWLKRELALMAEYACDDLALSQMGDRRQYARALLEVAYAMKSVRGRLLADAVPMAKETNVGKRMQQILDETRTIPPAFGRRGWAALLMCSLPVGYFASAVQLARAQNRAVVFVQEPPSEPQPVQIIAQARPPAPPPARPAAPAPSPAPAQPQTPADPIALARLRATLETPYRKWLDEDVRWIISDEERTAFNRLRTDDEHEAFIEQFWLRRDPTPGTDENEMKEEHYRRLAFANDRFTADVAGWKTDRGMIYIRYGPPDSLDTHTLPYPYEIWGYRFIEGLGANVNLEFDDPNMTGQYRLNLDPAVTDQLRLVPGAARASLPQRVDK